MSTGDVHILPINDLIDHDDTGGDCPCGGWHLTSKRERSKRG